MKRYILIIGFIISINLSFGQNNSTKLDCESLVSQLLPKFEKTFNNLTQKDTFNFYINRLHKECGISEFSQRMLIINKIILGENVDLDINTYLKMNFNDIFTERVFYTKQMDFGYIYSDNKAYWSYVPLKNNLDSTLILEAQKQLYTKKSNQNEELICTLFSGDLSGYSSKSKKIKNYQSTIYQYNQKKKDSSLGAIIYVGVYRPINLNKVFSYSPMLGLTFSTPYSKKWIGEIGLKVRFHLNNPSITYNYLGNQHNVHSSSTGFIQGNIGYKLFEKQKLCVITKIGAGLDITDTDFNISSSSKDKKTLNIYSQHFLVGIAFTKPFDSEKRIGIGFNYHYCPYNLDRDIISTIDSQLISSELFIRF